MNDQQKRQMGQVILLVVLLAVLAGSTVFMMRSLNPKPAKPAAPRPGTTAQTPPPAAAQPATTKKITDMPENVAATGKNAQRANKSLGNLAYAQLDPNLFKIYSMDPPRNPFALEERWFASVLEEQLPGYPQLEDSKYFESPELYLPDVWTLFGDRDNWTDVEIKREVEKPVFSLQGDSTNKEIATSISLTAAAGPSSAYTGVPTRAMTEPGWYQAPAGPTAAPPGNGDLFNEAGDGSSEGLPLPTHGEEMPRTGTPPPGDTFYCQGVTHRGGSAYALMNYNGQAFIVHEGTVLPPYYKVYQIMDDGVVLQDRRDDSSKWVPITASATDANVLPTSPTAPASAGAAQPSLGLDQLLQMLVPGA